MKNNSSSAKIIICVLAIVCIALIAVFIAKNKPDCAPAPADETPSVPSYTDTYDISGADVYSEDSSTEEMDSIPNDAGVPSDSTIS